MDATAIFKAYYQQIDPAEIYVPDDMARLHSYVPYVRGQSHVVAFNFLRRNYNLRDPVLLRVWVTGADAPQSKQVHQRIFPSDAVIHLDPIFWDSMTDFEGPLGQIHVQVVHPKAFTTNGEFRFFSYYQNQRGPCAAVHSLGAQGLKWLGPSLGSRAVLSLDRLHHAVDPLQVRRINPISSTPTLSPTAAADHTLKGPSFLVSTNDHFEVSAVWHDSDYVQTLRPSDSPRTLCPIRQVFPVLQFPEGLPRAWVDPGQIGFAPTAIEFKAYDHQGRPLAKCTWRPLNLPAVVDLQHLFQDSPACTMAYVVADFGADHGDFDSPALAYLQLWYPGREGSGDQVHSQITPSFWTDPAGVPASYRCRKFAPWVRDPALRWHFGVINLGGVGGNRDTHVQVRIFTDDGQERITRHTVPDEQLTWIDPQSLMDACGLQQSQSAVFQIESETTNFNAYWMVANPASGTHAIDHFTGG